MTSSFRKPGTLLGVVFLALAASPANADPIIPGYTFLGTAVNHYTNPSQWITYTYNVSDLVSGPETALLSFDIRNDVNGPEDTQSWVYFREESDRFLVHFQYSAGWDTSHWRDVRLQIGTTLLRDQYGSYNDHLGHHDLGTAYQGGGEAVNILGQTGFDAATYVLPAAPAAVPEPSSLVSAALGLAALAGYTGWRRVRFASEKE